MLCNAPLWKLNEYGRVSCCSHLCVIEIATTVSWRFLFVCRCMAIAFGRSWVLATIQYTIRHNDEGKKVGSSFHIRIGWHLQVE
jgi:hypothetical protein